MNKISTIITAWLVMMTFLSCSKSNVKEEIAILIPSDITRFTKAAELFAAKVNDMGYHCTIYNAKDNDKTQDEQATEAINNGAKCICISPVNGNSAASIVRNCKNNNVPIIAYNRLVNNCDLDCFIAGNIDKLAKMMFDVAYKQKPTGNYYLIGGDRFDLNGKNLQKKLLELIDPHVKSGDINLVYQTYTDNWNGELAARNISQAISLSGEKPDVVFAGFDGMARKISDELEKIYGSVNDIVITGQDAELESIKYIINGKQTMTAYHPVRLEAETCANVILALAQGKNIKGITGDTFNGSKNVPTIHVSSIMIDKTNIKTELIDRDVYTEEEIYE